MVNAIKTFRPAYRRERIPSRVFFVLFLLITGLFYLAAATNTASAATYYLDAVNGDDGNPGTSEQPWKTLAKAKSTVSDGDTVKLRTGNYGEYAENFGEAINRTDWVTYEADTGHTPVLTRIAVVASAGAVDSYLRFRDITVEIAEYAANYNAVYLRCNSYVQFYNCDIIGKGYITGNQVWGFFIRAAQHIVIDGCRIYGNGTPTADFDAGVSESGISYDGMGQGFMYGIVSDLEELGRYNSDITVTDCNIHGCGTAVGIVGTGWNVSNNEFHHLSFDGIFVNLVNTEASGLTDPILIENNHIHTGASIEAHLDAIQFSGYQINHVIIRGNHIHYWDGDSLYLKGDLNGLLSTDWLIENNLVYDTMRGANPVFSTVVMLNADNATFQNNTIIGKVEAALEGTPQTPMTFTVFANNIIKRINLGTDVGSQQTIVEYENNNIIGVTEGYGMGEFDWGDNSLMFYYANDPSLNYTRFNALFANAGNNDFTLAAGSEAIGFADPYYASATDILGVSRVSPPDAGCYEYVSQSNTAPVLQAIGDKSVNENSSLSFLVNATDADSDTITYSATGLPSGATFANQNFSWTPGYTQAGTYQVTFTASDGTASDSEQITITVSNTNQAPVLTSIGDKSVNENALLSFSVNAADADSDTITYSVESLPSGAVFVNQTFTWTPGYTQAGTHQVTFVASDSQAQDSETITITVNNVNRDPVLSSIGDKSVYAENSLSFSVSATDADSDTITHSATGLPSGATFANQNFSWTPGSSQAGSYDVTFTASDSQAQDSETITITVTADTVAPTVSNLSPAADSVQAPLNSLIYLEVTDSGKGVNASTVTIKVNSNLVYTGNTTDYSSSYGRCRRIGNSAAYKYIYQADENFDFDQALTVSVNATDLAANPMDEYSYSFKSEMRSFGENKILSSGSSNDNWGPLTVVSDSSGNIWVAWPQGVVGSRDIYVGKLVAGTDSFVGSGVVQVTNDIPDQGNPVIAVDSSDKLYLAWQDNRYGEWDIFVSTSTDGTNFSTERKITDPNSDQINPAMAIDSSDKVCIAWEDDPNGNKDIYIASSTNNFVSKTTSRITSNTYDQTTPAIAVDSDDTVYVVWTDQRNVGGGKTPKPQNDIFGAASNDSWANIPIVTKEESQSNPAIATEAVGSVLHLVWLDDTNGDDDIYYANTSNGLPSSPLTGSSIIDDTTGADQLSPVIITTGYTGNDLKVFACWRDERNADADLYAVEITASGTNIYVGDDNTSTDQSEPAIGIDEYDHPYLVWINGRTDICYAGSTFIEPTALTSVTAPVSTTTTVGTVPGSITNIDDVSAEIQRGAYLSDVKVTISRIRNPYKPPSNNRTFLYEFGPSATTFSEPVTITIPYNATTLVSSPSAYWYNPLTGLYSQDGITDVEVIQISSGLYALRFKTTHFSIFGGGGPFGGGVFGGGGGGGGGGCSMSPNGQGSIVEFLLPYIGLAVVMTILKLQDKCKKKMHDIAESE